MGRRLRTGRRRRSRRGPFDPTNHADQPLQHVGLAVPVDGVAGRARGDPGVQPGRLPRHSPARLVRRQARRRLDLLAHFLVGRLQPVAGPQHDLGAGTTRQGDPEEGLEHRRDLDVGQAEGLVQQDHRGLGIRADLGGGRSQGVGGLEGVPPLEAPVARGANADVDIELADQGTPRDLGLILGGDSGLADRASAMGASLPARAPPGLHRRPRGWGASGGRGGRGPCRLSGRASWAVAWAVPWRTARPGVWPGVAPGRDWRGPRRVRRGGARSPGGGARSPDGVARPRRGVPATPARTERGTDTGSNTLMVAIAASSLQTCHDR